jgi:hypothetical protein
MKGLKARHIILAAAHHRGSKNPSRKRRNDLNIAAARFPLRQKPSKKACQDPDRRSKEAMRPQAQQK